MRSWLIVLSLLLAPSFVLAHIVPTSYLPTESAVTFDPVEGIVVHLSERVEPSTVRLVLRQKNGGVVADGSRVSDDLRTISLPVYPRLSDGVYSVSWSVVSRDDGHFSKGSYSFAVGTTSEIFALPVIDRTSETSKTLFGFLEFLGMSLALGAFALSAPLRYAKAGLAIALFGTLGSVAVSLPASTPWSVYLETRVGFYAMARFFMLLGAMVIAHVRPRWFVLFVLADALLRAMVSHAAASLFAPAFSIFITAVHLFSKEFLVGMMLMGTLRKKPVIKNPLFALFLSLAVVSGGYMVWLHLKLPGNLFSTVWGQQIVPLILLTAFAALLQIFHEEGGGVPMARRVAGYTVPLSVASLLGILFLSSVSAFTSPPTPDGAHSTALGVGIFLGAFLFLASYFVAMRFFKENVVQSIPSWDAWVVALLLLVQLFYTFGPAHRLHLP